MNLSKNDPLEVHRAHGFLKTISSNDNKDAQRCADALKAVAEFLDRCPEAKFVSCEGQNFRNGIRIKLFSESASVTIASLLLACLLLSGCETPQVTDEIPSQPIPTAQAPTPPPDFTASIKKAKAACAARSYPTAHRYFMRTKCENIALRNLAKPKLSPATFHDYDGFLVLRLDIADKLDRHVITPEQSDIAILEAEWSLMDSLARPTPTE